MHSKIMHLPFWDCIADSFQKFIGSDIIGLHLPTPKQVLHPLHRKSPSFGIFTSVLHPYCICIASKTPMLCTFPDVGYAASRSWWNSSDPGFDPTSKTSILGQGEINLSLLLRPCNHECDYNPDLLCRRPFHLNCQNLPNDQVPILFPFSIFSIPFSPFPSFL